MSGPTHGQRCATAAVRALAKGDGVWALSYLVDAAREAVAMIAEHEGGEAACEEVQLAVETLLGLASARPTQILAN